MKLILEYLFAALLVFAGISASVKESPLKPRVVVITDVSTWETYDSESLVRFLFHTDLFEIEGMSGNEHICVIGFVPVSLTHKELTDLFESLL